jgi:hypothetical protein
MTTATRREFLELTGLGLVAGVATTLPIAKVSAATQAVRMHAYPFSSGRRRVLS